MGFQSPIKVSNLAIRNIGDSGVTTIAGGKSNVAGDLLQEAGVSTSKVKSEVQKFQRKEGKKVESASGNTTAVVERLAQKIVRGSVPSNLAEVRPMALDMGALVLGFHVRNLSTAS
ncbi:hypothetical protein AAG906_000923 [Vitis piasezkii]